MLSSPRVVGEKPCVPPLLSPTHPLSGPTIQIFPLPLYICSHTPVRERAGHGTDISFLECPPLKPPKQKDREHQIPHPNIRLGIYNKRKRNPLKNAIRCRRANMAYSAIGLYINSARFVLSSLCFVLDHIVCRPLSSQRSSSRERLSSFPDNAVINS